jgi:uncharacterized membrane protein YqhA
MDWNRLERQMISGTRLVTLIAVLCSLAGALLMLFMGLWTTIDAFRIHVTGRSIDLPHAEATMVLLISALDRFLIAIVLLFFGYGIYTLFVRTDTTPAELGLPRWLHVERIGQLKQTLAEVILVVLFVLFLRVALETFVASDPEMSWLGAVTFLLLPTAILLLAGALKLAVLHPKWPQKLPPAQAPGPGTGAGPEQGQASGPPQGPSQGPAHGPSQAQGPAQDPRQPGGEA